MDRLGKPIESKDKARYHAEIEKPKIQKMLVRVQRIGAKIIKHYKTIHAD